MLILNKKEHEINKVMWSRSLLTVDPAASAAKDWGAEEGTKKTLNNIKLHYIIFLLGTPTNTNA